MRILSAGKAEEYRTHLRAVIQKTEQIRAQVGNNVPERYLVFLQEISDLIILTKETMLEKKWFDGYLRIYQAFFFDREIDRYTTVAIHYYLKPWLGLGIDEKVENGQLNNLKYRFINVDKFNDSSYATVVVGKCKDAFKSLKLTTDSEADIIKTRNRIISVDIFTIIIRDKAGNSGKLITWCEDDFIYIEVNNENLSEELLNGSFLALSKLILS